MVQRPLLEREASPPPTVARGVRPPNSVCMSQGLLRNIKKDRQKDGREGGTEGKAEGRNPRGAPRGSPVCVRGARPRRAPLRSATRPW